MNDSEMENRTFEDEYELCERIAKGSCFYIRRCIKKQSGEQFAVKILDVAKFTARRGFTLADIRSEANIGLKLKHPHIIGLPETFFNDRFCYFVYELMEGADLCFEIVRRAVSGFVYSEAVASHYIRQMLDAIRYCHAKNVVHRTISVHALQLANKENSSPLKLTCFQSAIEIIELENNVDPILDAHKRNCSQVLLSDEREWFGWTGSNQFAAPEMQEGLRYGKPVDVWSLGVVLYVLLTGRLPYYGIDIQTAVMGRHWLDISDDVKDLIVRMMETDPQHRITVEEALKHPWIRERGRAPKIHLSDTVHALIKLNEQRKLKENVFKAVFSPSWSIISYSPNSLLPIDSDMTNLDSSPVTTGMDQVLSCLDHVENLSDCDNMDVLNSLFTDQQLASLLNIFDDIVHRQLYNCPIFYSDCRQKAEQVLDGLVGCTTAPAQELQHILSSPYFDALLQSMDVLSVEVYTEEYLRSGQTPSPSLQNVTVSTPLGGYSNGDANSTSPTVDNSQDVITYNDNERVTRVRLVQFQKNTDEPLGITLKMNNDGRCVLARIIHGGMIHRQGTLHVGDVIHEINGVSAAGQSVESVQKQLKDLRGSITLKVVPSYRNTLTQCEIFVRALFDYDPKFDDLIPCSQAGVQFHIGDVLQVISKDDHSWWQARRWTNSLDESMQSGSGKGSQGALGCAAGLIPSPELQEWRTATMAIDKSKHEQTVRCGLFHSRSKRKSFSKDKYLAKHNAMFDQLDLVTYEEVVRLPAFTRKTLVLLGAHGVGRRHIKNTLISNYQDRFAYPIPHTTRTPRKEEEQGKHYYFVSHQQMMNDIAANEYLEYGTHEDAMYGTKLDTIRHIHSQNLMAILDIEPQALKVLRTAEYAPYVVFIAAPKDISFTTDSSLERLARESELLEKAYQHYFDFKIHNNDIEETIRQLLLTLEDVSSLPQWVPVSWVY